MPPCLGEAAVQMQNAASQLLGLDRRRRNFLLLYKSLRSSRDGESCGSALPWGDWASTVQGERRKRRSWGQSGGTYCHRLMNPGHGIGSSGDSASLLCSAWRGHPEERNSPLAANTPSVGTQISPTSALPSLQRYKQHWQ